MPGETKTVEFILDKRAFAEWNVQIHDWYVPDGAYKIQIGRSAAEIVAEETVNIFSTIILKPHFTINSPMGDMLQHPVAAPVLKEAMAELMGKECASRMHNIFFWQESGRTCGYGVLKVLLRVHPLIF